MTNEEIVKVLRGMAMDVFRTCEGCDLEENCSVRGCAILMAAADAMENLQTENAALRRTIDNLTSAQAVVLKEFEAKLEELAEVKAERDAAVEDIRKILTSEYEGICEFCANYENPDAGCLGENGFGGWCCKNATWLGPQKEA